MSLFSAALRIAAVNALRGRTIAGQNVIDTVGSIGDSAEDAARLAIVVESGSVAGKSVTLTLTLSVMVRTVLATEIGPRIDWGVPAASLETERVLDLLAHQVARALHTKDGSWGHVFVDLTDGLETIRTLTQDRGENGLAVRTLTLQVQSESYPLTRKTVGDRPKWERFLGELDALPPGEMMTERALFEAAFIGSSPVALSTLGLDCGLTIEQASAIVNDALADQAPLATIEPVVPAAVKPGGKKRAKAA